MQNFYFEERSKNLVIRLGGKSQKGANSKPEFMQNCRAGVLIFFRIKNLDVGLNLYLGDKRSLI